MREFGPRFIEKYAKANQQKPSEVASKESILRLHLVPAMGDKRLDEITTEEVQGIKASLTEKKRAAKTINNVLSVLGTLLKTAVKWREIPSYGCEIQPLKTAESAAAYHDFDAFERLVAAAREDSESAHLIVLLGGEAGLRCGEVMGLEWQDINFDTGKICVERADWKGQVTLPKGGRIRFVSMTTRLTEALPGARHLRGKRVLCDEHGKPLTRKIVYGLVRRVARRAQVKAGVHILRHTFCSHLAMRGAPPAAIQKVAGHRDLKTTERYMHLSPEAEEDAIRLLESRWRWRNVGDGGTKRSPGNS